MDSNKPQSTGNFMSCGSREHLLSGAQDGRKMESNRNNVVDCVVQSDYPETLDGSFLSLGVDVNTESRSSVNASSRDFIGKIDGAINSQLNPSHGQSGYGSSLSHDFKMATGLSDFQTHSGGFSSIEENAVGLSGLEHYIGGFPNIMQNAGESSSVSVLPGAMENVDGWSLSENDLGVAVSTSSNFSLSPLKMLPMPQSHVPHPILTPGDQKFKAGLANVDLNQDFHDLSGVSSMVHSSSQSGLSPNQSFHSRPGISPMEHSSSQSGLPVQGQLRAPRPSVYSFKTRKYDMASNQLQRCNMGTIPSLPGTSVSSPVLGNIESTSSQYQSDHLFDCDGSASQVASSYPFSKNFVVQTTSEDELSASEGIAAEVASIIPSFNNIGVEAADTELLQLSGYNCLLCKRDLSYTPEGPVFQPAAPPTVAVLSCGHCFHDLCLQRMTSEDEANNPSCIPCVIGES